ncbi:hypothetical protein P8452_08876 [Trifolium repens]|nr:hypothetical protein P8452_08876 [Trifolium repens]
MVLVDEKGEKSMLPLGSNCYTCAYGGLILEWCDEDDCCMLKVIEVLDLWGSAGSLVMVVMVWMEEIDGYGGLVIVNEIRG